MSIEALVIIINCILDFGAFRSKGTVEEIDFCCTSIADCFD